MFGIPSEATDITEDDLYCFFPTPQVIEAWSKGEDPPVTFDEEEDDESILPALRFNIGTKVECRIGPDPVTGWATGVITQLWYREEQWPQDSFAPYRVLLDDGRSIYVPGDLDSIVRKVIEVRPYNMWAENSIWG